MIVPHPIPFLRPRLRVTGLALLLLLCVMPLQARGPEPPRRIPLEPLGFQPLSTQFLLAGSSLFTVHYVDDTHLLLTFTVRRLLSRLPDEPDDDQDRNIDALLLDLPTGQVLARTSWRLHDHGQYLWSLGRGHFLLRIRDRLTTFAPLAHLETGSPFAERPFLNISGRRIGALLLSPDADMLVIESLPRTPPVPRTKTPLFGPTPAPAAEPREPNSVQINFYRIPRPDDSDGEIRPRSAGVVRSSNLGSIPMDTAGYIDVLDQGRQHWAFDFDSYAGKSRELSAFDSTCRPAPVFVSRSEFIAFGCHSGNTRQLLGGFNMRGEEMWEQNLYGDYLAPSLVFATSNHRFALGRVLVRTSAVPDQPLNSDELSSQNVVVYQAGSGKQILRAECSPIERAGQNFALSPNGLSLAVIHADAIEIYSLPPLTDREEADLKLAQAAAPEDNDSPVHFKAAHESVAEAQAAPSDETDNLSTDARQGTQSNLTSTRDEQTQPPAASAATAAGDSSPNQPRKPPTLYTLPSDPPHNSTNERPQS